MSFSLTGLEGLTILPELDSCSEAEAGEIDPQCPLQQPGGLSTGIFTQVKLGFVTSLKKNNLQMSQHETAGVNY